MKKIGYKKYGLIPREYFSQGLKQKMAISRFWKAALFFVLVATGIYLIVTWPYVPVQARYYLSEAGIQIGNIASNFSFNSNSAGQAIDSDQDGLTDTMEINFFGTNPNNPDTDGDGMNDGLEVASGTNPLSADPGVVDSDNDGLTDQAEVEVYGTDPRNSDTDGDGYPDALEIIKGFSPVFASSEKKAMTLEQRSRDIKAELGGAHIIIPKIGVDAPIIWLETTDDKAILDAMPAGVVHYAKSAFPGNPGNVVIVGHSSNYWWIKGEYNQVFALLDKLEDGDEITIQNSNIRFTYRVQSKEIRNADQTDYFEHTNEPTLTLQTSWPVGTSARRLVLKSLQTSPTFADLNQ